MVGEHHTQTHANGLEQGKILAFTENGYYYYD